MTEDRFLEFIAAWDRRDLDAMMRFVDDECVYEPAVGPEPGYTAVGREAVRHVFAEEFAVAGREFLDVSPSFWGARGMWEWTAFQRQPGGYPLLQRGCEWCEFIGDQIHRISGYRKVSQSSDARLDKSALLANIRASYDRFQARLAPLSEAQLTTPGAIGTWSIKDLVAHLTGWHEIGVERYQAVAEGREIPDEPEDDVDQVNAALIAPYSDQSLAQVLAAFRALSRQVTTIIESLSEADLFEEGRFSWMEGHALWEGIANNTFAHYDEHGPMIQAWIDSQPAR
jgi:hypothetical protein